MEIGYVCGKAKATVIGTGMNILPALALCLFCVLAAVGLIPPARAATSALVIAMPNWPSGQAAANILKVAIEEKFNLTVEVREIGVLGAFAAMDRGEVAIHPEVWRPNLNDLIDRYVTKKQSIKLTTHSVPAWQGLCATEAATKLGLKTVADLSDSARTAALDTDGDGVGELWIGAAAWLSTGIERVRAQSYGYARTLSLVEAEEDVAMAAVDVAVASDQPMVFYCYSPHHLFRLHKISRIEEPAHDPAKWQLADPADPLWVSKSSAPVACRPAGSTLLMRRPSRKRVRMLPAFSKRSISRRPRSRT